MYNFVVLHFPQNFPPDSTKIRSQIGGWLYAFEIPDPLPPITFRTIPAVPAPTPHIITSHHNHNHTPHISLEEAERESKPQCSGGNGTGALNGVEEDSEKSGEEESQRRHSEENGSEEAEEERGREKEGTSSETAKIEEEEEDIGSRDDSEGEKNRSESIGSLSNPEDPLQSRSSSTNDILSTDHRTLQADRPLGSRDPTPPILLAPEDDDRLTGDLATGFRALGSQERMGGPATEGSLDPGRRSGGMVESATPSPSHPYGFHDGFVFGIHRKTVCLLH